MDAVNLALMVVGNWGRATKPYRLLLVGHSHQGFSHPSSKHPEGDSLSLRVLYRVYQPSQSSGWQLLARLTLFKKHLFVCPIQEGKHSCTSHAVSLWVYRQGCSHKWPDLVVHGTLLCLLGFPPIGCFTWGTVFAIDLLANLSYYCKQGFAPISEGAQCSSEVALISFACYNSDFIFYKEIPPNQCKSKAIL